MHLEDVFSSGHELAVDEDFSSGTLDESRWIPFYLPHWAGRANSAASYRIVDEKLELFVASDQPVWHPDVEPTMRVSSLQTGLFAGPLGSTVGQHRTHDRLVVVEEQTTQRLLTPMFGVIELRARWTPQPEQMVALWMIGVEEDPVESGEICVCEIFGSEADEAGIVVGAGVRPFNDPSLVDDFVKRAVPIDLDDFHDFAVAWTPDGVTFFVDGDQIHQVDRSPRYPMQLMLDIYDFAGPQGPASTGPFVIDHVRISTPTGSNGPAP
jgi:hypothetical protein